MSQGPVLVESASLHGKVALITGAGRGIGRGCAIELGKRGCSVIVNYANSKSSADEVCALIEKTGSGAKAISIQADVSKVSEIDRLFQEAKKAFGKIDIVMSNSGTESWDKTEEITEEKFDHVFNLNARAQFFVGQAAWKYLEQNGRLILMSSIAAGLLGVKDHVLYNASKMAVIGMIKAFATDFGAKGITVNGVAPGGIKSDMFTQNAWHYSKQARGGEPVEVEVARLNAVFGMRSKEDLRPCVQSCYFWLPRQDSRALRSHHFQCPNATADRISSPGRNSRLACGQDREADGRPLPARPLRSPRGRRPCGGFPRLRRRWMGQRYVPATRREGSRIKS